MKDQTKVVTTEKKKVISIGILFATSIIIMFLGVFFSIFSVLNNISFRVLNASIHGLIFGIMVIYLGVRNYLSVRKLKLEVYKNTSYFSWQNFKKEKKECSDVKYRK